MTQPDIIETLLEKPYHVIDVLPKQVPSDSPGQYFKVEKYFLSRLDVICRHFADLVIKLNCYAEMQVSTDGESWGTEFSPEDLVNFFSDSVTNHSPLYLLINSDDALITFSGEDHYMTLYNASAELLELIGALAGAEGLFLCL